MSPSAASARPSRAELAAAEGTDVADVIAPGLSVLFCGINPGLYSGATGHHFARPGNRFWKVLHLASFTERELGPEEDRELLTRGLGITNLVERATVGAGDLRPDELRAGGAVLAKKIERFRPRLVAFLGMGAYRVAFDKRATLGRQRLQIAGAGAWLLPNPSGLQARYQLADLVALFGELRQAIGPVASTEAI